MFKHSKGQIHFMIVTFLFKLTQFEKTGLNVFLTRLNFLYRGETSQTQAKKTAKSSNKKFEKT